MVCRPALCPPCSLQRLPLSPTKGSERLLTVPYRALVRAQRGELMDPLPCNLAAMFLYKNPGHCLKSPKKFLAIKFWRFSVLGMGSGVSPVSSSSSSVVSGKTRVFRIAKKGQVAKNGRRRRGQRVAAPNGPPPQPTPKAHAANCQIKESRKMVSSSARR